MTDYETVYLIVDRETDKVVDCRLTRQDARDTRSESYPECVVVRSEVVRAPRERGGA